MFEVPAAKRLKRSELFEDGDELRNAETSDDQESDLQHERQRSDSFRYTLDLEYVDKKSALGPAPAGQDSATDEFSFKLFKPKAKSTKVDQIESVNQDSVPAIPNRISIRSPSPPPDSVSAGRFDKTRPDSYYFTPVIGTEKRANLYQQFVESAVTGDTVKLMSTLSWPGSTHSWRVISLPAHSKQIVIDKTTKAGRLNAAALSATSGVPDGDGETMSRKRVRPSKKRRIFLRIRTQKRRQVQKKEQERLETEQERKTRKNRERKVKRKMKEKRDKEAAASAGKAAETTPSMDAS